MTSQNNPRSVSELSDADRARISEALTTGNPDADADNQRVLEALHGTTSEVDQRILEALNGTGSMATYPETVLREAGVQEARTRSRTLRNVPITEVAGR